MANDFDPISRRDGCHDQMEEALASLSRKDKLQLIAYAHTLARTTGQEASDLYQEALLRMLSGTWQWSIATFKEKLMRVMWSVSSTWRESRRARANRDSKFHIESNPAPVPFLLDSASRRNERIEKLRERLLEKNDEQAFLFLEAILEGKTYQEARMIAGIDAGQPFNTLTRRLRRQIERL